MLTAIAASPERKKAFIEDIRNALYASKIVSYAQGYMLMRAAAKEYGWNLNYGGIALMWRGGCIIRSRFLSKIKDAFDKNHDLANLMLDDRVLQAVRAGQFNVYAVRHVDEALSLLVGEAAGHPDEKGRFPKGSVNARVVERLRDIAEIGLEEALKPADADKAKAEAEAAAAKPAKAPRRKKGEGEGAAS